MAAQDREGAQSVESDHDSQRVRSKHKSELQDVTVDDKTYYHPYLNKNESELSDVWNYFQHERETDYTTQALNKVFCMKCPSKMKDSGETGSLFEKWSQDSSTTPMVRHLRAFHPEALESSSAVSPAATKNIGASFF